MEYLPIKRQETNIEKIVDIAENSPLVRKTYYSRAKSALRKYMVYASAIAATFTLPSLGLAQTRESLADEDFTGGIITKNYLAEDPAKWSILPLEEKLQVKDFDEDWGDTETIKGYTRFSIIGENTLLKMTEKNASIEAQFEISDWITDGQQVGFCIGDPTELKNGTYYKISINAHPLPPRAKVYMVKIFPGRSDTYYNATTTLLAPGTKNFKMKYSYDSNGHHLFLNDVEDPNFNSEIKEGCISCPALLTIEGYPIMAIYDESSNPHTPTTASFDNIIIEADAPATLADGDTLTRKRIRRNLMQKVEGETGRQITPEEIPHRFMRGDSNMDGVNDISDPINTLNYRFLGTGNVRCPDAADINDDGEIDLSDAIFSLNRLFMNPSLTIPPPNAKEIEGKLVFDSANGIDTTEDKLPVCNGY